jgi:tetratricopeptide (TPR) repeat protein
MKKFLGWVRAHRTGLLLFGIFAAGLALRVWGLSSAYQRIDDIPVAKKISWVYYGDWKPDAELFYPLLFNYIVGILMRVLSLVLGVLGVHRGPGLFEFTFAQTLLIARFVSATMGAATILVVFKIGRRLFSEATGLAAAFFFAFSSVHVLYSHQIVLDVPMTFFYALALYFCVRILEGGRWPHYLAAAVLAGLATATKYNGIFVVVSILAAHIWFRRRTRAPVLRILFDPKLIAAAAVSLLSFFAGHPYALLWAPSFLKATKELAKWVHATEYYLMLIKPRTLLEKIVESNYAKGIWNVLSAEGWVLFLLLVLGLVWVFRRKARGSAFLAVSGLIYFLGCLGFLGFSRLRDLSTLSLFYAFFAAFGLASLGSLFRRRGARPAFVVLFAAAVVLVGLRTTAQGYYLHEDDTTQIAERWIERNLPPASRIGREWFTPELAGSSGKFRMFDVPFLCKDFPPFNEFDFVLSSSASNGFFYKYRKYYPNQVAIYEDLDLNHELLKDFWLRPIEYKNPDVKLYSGRAPRHPKERVSLPSMPADPTPLREFDFVDGSVYGKDIETFVLTADQPLERVFLSRTPVSRLGVFLSGAEGDGDVVVRSGGRSDRIPVRANARAAAVIEPRRAFPYFRYMYRVRLEASAGIKECRVAVRADDYAIGLAYFGAEDFGRAEEFFRRALEAVPAGSRDAEIFLYLALCANKTNRAGEERRYLDRFLAFPQAARLASLYVAAGSPDDWDRLFEKYTGIPPGLLAATKTALVDDDKFEFENGAAFEDGALINGRAWAATGAASGLGASLSSPILLPAQSYRAEFAFLNAAGATGEIGEAEVTVENGGPGDRMVSPLRLDPPGPDRISRGSIHFSVRPVQGRVRVRFRLAPNVRAAFDGLWIVPDLRAFFLQKGALFRDYIKRVT